MPDEHRLLFNEISLKFVKFHRLWYEMDEISDPYTTTGTGLTRS